MNLDDLPPTCDVPTAAKFLGISRNTAFALVSTGDFPVRTLRLGRKIRVVTADLKDVLGVPNQQP